MQKALTVIARIKPGRADSLLELLEIIGHDIEGERDNTYLRFAEIKTLHFGRWVMLPNQATGGWDYLLFTSNYDDSLRIHLDEFIDKFGATMDAIWGSCVGYPEGRTTDPAAFKTAFYDWIKANSIDCAAFYVGYHHQTVADKRRFVQVRAAIQQFFDMPEVERLTATRIQALKGSRPRDILKAFDDLPEAKQHRTEQVEGTLAAQPGPIKRPRPAGVVNTTLFVMDLLWSLLQAVVVKPLLQPERELNLNLDDRTIQPGVAAIEDAVTQNQLTVISRIKPGWWTLVKLRAVLTATHVVGKYFENRGSLGGIATIHFARWCILDRGRWLLFTSNYDGSWDSYIGDFVDKAATGMDLIWRSAPGYPADGSRDIEAFKNIIRVNQVRTQTFYSAFPDQTIINLMNDGEIVDGMNRAPAESWLRRL
jgi:hypothetical protein